MESSLEKPFLGWNEGINTSASLSYLLGTFFRQLPTNESKCLDLIPVDLVCRGMTLISAALVTRRHQRVYQLATSVANACNMRRSIELTGLGHRKFYRAHADLQQRMRARFDAIPVSKTRYKAISAPAQKAVVQAINRATEPFASKPPLARQERELEKVIKLISLFEPFILHNDHVFEAANVERLSAALPSRRTGRFRLRFPRPRLVGLLDQRPHSRSAQVVLSSHRRTPAGIASPALRAARIAQRSERDHRRGSSRRTRRVELGFIKLGPGNGVLTLNHCGYPPDRFHRIYRRAHRVEFTHGPFRPAESSRSRAQ